MKKVSVVIPTYNGKDLLEEHLPFLRAALEAYPGDSEIIIVDNGSNDESLLFLSRNYPEARIIKNKVNEGFGPAINRGVKEAKYDIVLLLNNDIRVERGFIDPLVRHFEDPSVFAVVSKSLVKLADRVVNESVTVPGFDGGLIFSHQPFVGGKTSDKIKNPCTNFHASGGFGAFDRNKFLELGGFDDIFHPFYYEDVDLSYQAWKRGWLILYEPDSVVHHRSHATSLKVATQSYISRIEIRNRFLITWKTISDPVFVLSHLKWILSLFLRSFRLSKKKERRLMIIMLFALRRLPAVIAYRIKNAKYTRLSDNRIFYLAANRDTPNLKFDRLLSEETRKRSQKDGIMKTIGTNLEKKSAKMDFSSIVKRYENTRTTISVYVPFNFLPQTFGGGVRCMNVYENLSYIFNVNLIGIIGYGEKFQRIEVNENCTAYLIPMSKEYCDLLNSEQEKAGGLLHDILLTNEYKLIPNLIDINNQLEIETDIFVSAQPYFFKMFLEYFNDKILIYEAQNVDYDLKRTYFQHPDTNESAKYYLNMVSEVELLACHKSEYILGVSNEDVDKLCDIYNINRNKIVMVPNGIDVHACQYIYANKRKINRGMVGKSGKHVVFIGSAHGPNIESVQYILDEIAGKNCNIHYTIIGNMKLTFKKKMVPPNVHFTGMISEEEKKKIYGTADLAINPMFSGSGTNLKVLEYLAYGIPLVSTKFGMRGLGVFDHCIYYAQKDNFLEIIERTLLLPADVLEDNARKARKICEENFDKSVITAGLINVIKETEKQREWNNDKLRIAIDGRILYRNMTGSERYIYELVKNIPNEDQENEYEYCLINNTGFKLKGVSNIQYISLKEKIDLFHRTYQVNNYNDILELLIAGKSVFSFLDLIMCKNHDYFLKKEDHDNYISLMNLAFNFSDRIIAISEHAKKDVVATFNISEEKITVVYLGIDLDKFKIVNDGKAINDFRMEYNLPKKYLLYVGTDYPHKNLKNLFIAFSKIINLPEMRDYSLVIAGNSYYRKGPGYLQAYLEPIKHRVVSLGYFADENMHLLYNAADIFVFPSLYEGFGLTVLEAFACGVPLICSNATSLPEVAGDAAYMVDAKDPEQIAAAILDVVKNPQLRNMLVKRGLERVKQFTWEKCAKNTHNIYKQVLLGTKDVGKDNEKYLRLLLSKIVDGNMSYLGKNDGVIAIEKLKLENLSHLAKLFFNGMRRDGILFLQKLVNHYFKKGLRK
ncbi:MAG: hypothetical protein A2Y65_03110 [Deltaproteobacteria bacterium RBG_13_52_11]|nr:MAG: hypothetical protein A2Y65_03110 [Deltaproteobacteria bacterium RBG_13_52_11]